MKRAYEASRTGNEPVIASTAISTARSTVKLPTPKLRLCKSVADALRLRKTVRAIRDRKLGAQLLSDLLFAARGVNRAHGPFGGQGITAASASNSQEVDVYVALEIGTFRFDARRHLLEPVVDEDLRRFALGPHQPPISAGAPLHLIFVVDIGKLEHTIGFEEPGLHDPEVQKSYYYVDTGIIAGNVYLFAASRGLACWFHNCDRARLAQKLKLRKEQRVLFAQTVGFPARDVAMAKRGTTTA